MNDRTLVTHTLDPLPIGKQNGGQMEKRLFTSESVTEGHPDKICDAVSDAVLDALMEQDPFSRVACETCTNTGFVLVMGEITTKANIDIPAIVRKTVTEIGYDSSEKGFDGNTCAVMVSLDKQSADIAMGVDKALEARESHMTDEQLDAIGAGDQGMMFGYACRDTEEYMPLPLALSHLTLQVLAEIRKKSIDLMPYLRPDAKSQFTIEYDENNHPVRVHTIVVSTQHDEFVAPELGNMSYDEAVKQFGLERVDKAMHDKIEKDVREILLPKVLETLPEKTAALFDGNFILHVNPTGKFVIGGPHGDTGLTGRKIIVDTYGGRGAHGGGAFSGKDPSKVDRSAAYAARHIAKNLVAAGVADEVLVQLAYAIGVARPVSIFVNTYGTAKNGLSDAIIAEKVGEIFDLRPAKIIEKFQLKNPIYEPTASYGHVGRKPYTKAVKVIRDGKEVEKVLQFFGWELLDAVPKVKEAFGL